MSTSKPHVKCTCGTWVELAKGQPLPPCNHVARSIAADDPDFRPGPADAYQFFTPRLRRREQSLGQVSTKPTNRVPTRVRVTKPSKLAAAREARQLAGQIRQRDVRRREWAAILPWLDRATARQIDAYRLHMEQGLTVKEVADKLSLSERAAKDRIDLARGHEQRSRQRARIA